jgi:DNA replication factor GINS
LETKQAKKNINGEYVVVRILKDLPTFTGADSRNYTVSAEDVVVLPQLNATGLIKRNAAKLIAGQENL